MPPVPRPSPLEDRELPGASPLGLLVFGLPGGSRDGEGNEAVEGGGGDILIEGGGTGLGGEFGGGGVTGLRGGTAAGGGGGEF